MQSVGGQAVIEGVLIKGKDKLAIAVRNPQGEIVVKEEESISITKKHKFLDIPFFRGPILLVETMIMGLKALNYSSIIAMDEDEEEQMKGTGLMLFFTMLFSIAFALVLFKMVPLGAAELAAAWNTLFENRYLFNVTEGIVKISILIGYIYIISFMPDVRRVFQYHGAEHKVVNAYENNDLDHPEKYSTIHVRCGTSFMLFVLALSILVYLFLPIDVGFWAKYGLRLLLLPVVAGIAYELIKISPKYEHKVWFKALISPGLFLQRITTKEPDKKQLEVAMAALKRVI